MIRDAEHFSTKMSKIEGSGNLGEYIVDLVKSKPLPEKEALAASAITAEEKNEEPQGEVMFDAADLTIPAGPSGSTSPAPGEEEKKAESAPEKTETSADPPLPPTPEQMEEAERKKAEGGNSSGDSSPSTATEEAKLNGIEAANEMNEAMGKELPPTPMEVDEKDKMGR